MVRIPDLIDFCFLHAPKGFHQDSNDQEYAKEMAVEGKVERITFTYDCYTPIVISVHPPRFFLELNFELWNEKESMQPFFEFAEKLRKYVMAHSTEGKP